MAYRLQLVAFRIADIGAVIVGVIMGAEPRRALVAAAIGKRRGMKGIDRCPVGGDEGDVGAIADRHRFAIKGRADENLGASRRAIALPSLCRTKPGCPSTAMIAS